MTPSIVELFWSKIERQSSGCWVWIGSRSPEGYGLFSGDRGRVGAHRFAYELLVEPIPVGLHIDHLCRNPPCVNPSHLEAVTPGENVRRGIGPTAANARKTHCPHGHPLDGRRASGGRYCKTCARQAYHRNHVPKWGPAEWSAHGKKAARARWDAR